MTENAARPRIPDANQLVPEIQNVARELVQATMNGSVPATTTTLMFLRAGQIVGNTYQAIRHTMALREAGESEQRITAVATWWDAPYFTEAERAALALTEAVFEPNPRGEERVSDELFARVAQHYDEKALATLMVTLASAGFWMVVALVLKPPAFEQES